MGRRLSDETDGRFYVLVNDDRQYQLWPSSAEMPVGWLNVFGAEGRRQCLDYVAEYWTELRPASRHDAMAG